MQCKINDLKNIFYKHNGMAKLLKYFYQILYLSMIVALEKVLGIAF